MARLFPSRKAWRGTTESVASSGYSRGIGWRSGHAWWGDKARRVWRPTTNDRQASGLRKPKNLVAGIEQQIAAVRQCTHDDGPLVRLAEARSIQQDDGSRIQRPAARQQGKQDILRFVDQDPRPPRSKQGLEK